METTTTIRHRTKGPKVYGPDHTTCEGLAATAVRQAGLSLSKVEFNTYAMEDYYITEITLVSSSRVNGGFKASVSDRDADRMKAHAEKTLDELNEAADSVRLAAEVFTILTHLKEDK